MCNCGCENGTCGCSEKGCACSGSRETGFQRRYRTKAERSAELEAYLAKLKAEVQAVEELLANV